MTDSVYDAFSVINAKIEGLNAIAIDAVKFDGEGISAGQYIGSLLHHSGRGARLVRTLEEIEMRRDLLAKLSDVLFADEVA
jgi:hypothetical protein